MEHYSAAKIVHILKNLKWKKPEQKNYIFFLFHFHEMLRRVKFTETKGD